VRTWIAGVLATVVAAVLIFWATKPFEHWFENSKPPSITGAWEFTQTSDSNHQPHPGSMTLTADGEVVSGRMTTWDKTDSAVRGMFVADRLSLTRETGMKGTVQFIEMKMNNANRNEFSGTYRNEGTVQDNGTILMHR
jgi:hypothetical protein